MKGSSSRLSCLVFVVFVLGGKWATVEILLLVLELGVGVQLWVREGFGRSFLDDSLCY